MPCLWEKRFNKHIGGRVSDLSNLSSRIIKKRNAQEGAEHPGLRRAAWRAMCGQKGTDSQEVEQPAGCLVAGEAPIFQEGSLMDVLK